VNHPFNYKLLASQGHCSHEHVPRILENLRLLKREAFEESINCVAGRFITRAMQLPKHSSITTDGTVSNIVSIIM